MKTSLSAFVYLNFPLETALRRIAAAGYDGVDIWGGRPHAYRRDLTRQDLAGIRQLLDELQLGRASFIPAQFRYPTCLCSGNETIRRDSVAYIRDGIETAAALSVPVVSVCPGHSLYGQSHVGAEQRLCASLDELCEFAAPYGIRLALEPADRYETDLVQTTGQALQLINRLGRDNLGVVLDTGHCHVVGEDPAEAVRTLQEKLFHVHVDDNLGQRDQHLVPGEGNMAFAPFMAALREGGYDGFVCVELAWDYTVDPEPAVLRSFEFLKTLMD